MRNISDSIAHKYAREAFKDHFESQEAFDTFVKKIQPNINKKKFLHISTIYLFLVKCGDWNVKVEESNAVVDYFTNSYKLVTLFSLIESLSTEKYVDFFEWLNSKERKRDFPLGRKDLGVKYDEYKSEYGSIKKCKTFFEALPSSEKTRLVKSFTLKSGELTIEEIASYLYNLRSKFTHEAEFILELGTIPHLVREADSYTFVKLSLNDFMNVFELGVIEYFKVKPETDEA